MSRERGVFAVARDIWEHPTLADDAPFSKREAWLWLISCAAWGPIQRGICGQVITLQRGEFCYSVRFLEVKWGWSKSRVDRFLSTLKKWDMVRDASRDSIKIYYVSKYNDYQILGLPERDSVEDAMRDNVGTAAGQQRDKEETLKHLSIKKVSKTKRNSLNGHVGDFQAFYDIYPLHESRGDAEKAYAAALGSGATVEELLVGAQRYAAACVGKERKFIKYPAGWLRAKKWLDEPQPGASDPDAEMRRRVAHIAELNRLPNGKPD